MKKLTKEQTDEIIKLKSEGMDIKEIAIKFGVKTQTILYWTDEKYRNLTKAGSIRRFKSLPEEVKKTRYKDKKEYMKNYMKRRYQTDEVFRNKQKERVRNGSKQNTN